MKLRLLFLLISFLSGNLLFAQTFSLTGTVLDGSDNSELIGVPVVVSPTTDTAMKYGNVTDEEGHFVIDNLPAGSYLLKIAYIGFESYTRTINLTQTTAIGTLKLKISSTQLTNVTVTEQAVRGVQSGDTTSFNANAYKTNPDAVAEDLLNKMPGISTQGGTLKANGEDVKQVLVDGKPFFGDDPSTAIKNLPAEVIDKIQVFDKLSDQAQLTGFDDGNAQKTINIVTKPGKNTGQFGKIYGAAGAKDLQMNPLLYSVGGNMNHFKGDTRISFIVLSNNINQQNFSSDDLTGVMSANSGGGRRGGDWHGGGGIGNFLVGQQGGITKTNSIGLNYSDQWGKNIKVSGSYFFNNTNNENRTGLARTYFSTNDSLLLYREQSNTHTSNTNHRANLRVEYEIDSNNTLILTPRISFQLNDYARILTGDSKRADSSRVSATDNRTSSLNNGYNFSNNLVYRHKFNKKGRTLSLNLNTQINNRGGEGSLYSVNEYIGSDTDRLDQRYDLTSDGYTLSGSLNYTEPLGKNSQLMANYAPSFSGNKSDKQTLNRENGDDYTAMDTLLSNKYENTYTTHRGGLSYRYNSEKIRLTIGADYQDATLDGLQIFPYAFKLQKNFSNLLPNAWFNYKFSKNSNLRIMYRTRTQVPSIQQLQSVIDNSNPLLLRTGNPNLAQSYQHSLMLRYGSTNTQNATTFNAMAFANYTNNYIANQTLIATTDSIATDGIILPIGGQLTRPVNLDGYYSIRSFVSYGMPLSVIKSNLNLNTGINFTHTPGYINDRINYADNYSFNGGVVVSSNVSENLDFTLSYNGNYNVVKNTINKRSDNNYYTQNTSARLNWIFLGGFTFTTSLDHQLYSGLSQGFNQNFLLWNA